ASLSGNIWSNSACDIWRVSLAFLGMSKKIHEHRIGVKSGIVPLQRRGGRAIKKISPKASFEKARTGWSKTFLTTPSAPAKVASQHFLDVAATPPLEEGIMSSLSVPAQLGNSPVSRGIGVAA